MRKKLLLIVVAAVAVNFIPVYASEALSRPQSTMLNVPYTLQAPLGNWSDSRQMYGCEEAAIAMAMAWARGGGGVPADEFLRDIINMAEYEKVIFGFHEDTSAEDTARVMRDIYQYKDVLVRHNISTEDIKMELTSNRVVLVPLNTRSTGMNVYRNGPVRHTVLAVGYDDATDHVIVHDPLFSNGQNLWIPAAALNQALWDYESGVHRALPARTTALISVGKSL